MNPRRYLDDNKLSDFKKDGLLSLGNIYYFRSLPKPFGDEIEGKKYLKSGEGDQFELNREELLKFFEGSNIKIDVPFLKCVGGDVSLGSDFPNALVFCVAAGEHEVLKTHFGRDKYFTITDTKRFGDAILEELRKKYNIIAHSYDWVSYVKTKNYKDNREIYSKEENIAITPKPGQIINATIVKKYFGSYFTKEETFSIEKEYRFVFLTEEDIKTTDQALINVSTDVIMDCIVFDD